MMHSVADCLMLNPVCRGRLPTTCTVLYLQIRLADSPETLLTSDESSGPCISFMSSTGLTPAQTFKQEDISADISNGPLSF